MNGASSVVAGTFARRFYKEQLEFLKYGKTDELIDSHYHVDAVLVSSTDFVRGRESLKRHFRAYMTMLGRIEVLSLDSFTDAKDSLLFEATVRTKLGEAKVYDAFVFRGGKATHHFTGVK